jgi:hypothetical protein
MKHLLLKLMKSFYNSLIVNMKPKDARQGEIIRDSTALTMWQDYDTI